MAAFWRALCVIPAFCGAALIAKPSNKEMPLASTTTDQPATVVQFLAEGSSQPVPLEALKAGIHGSLTVKSSSPGFAVLFQLNSSASLSMISDPVTLVPGHDVTIKARSGKGPFSLEVISKKEARSLLGGGPNFTLFVTKDRRQMDKLVERAKAKKFISPKDVAPALEIELVGEDQSARSGLPGVAD